MTEELKQPVVIVNRPAPRAWSDPGDGASYAGRLHDRHLFLLTDPDELYDTEPPSLNNVVPIAKVMYSPATLTVTANFPAKTLAEFVQYAKANPGKVRAGTSGKGRPPTSSARPSIGSPASSRRMFPSPGMHRRSPPWRGTYRGDLHSRRDVHPMVKAGKMRMLAVAMQERHYLYPMCRP